ncbi:phospholipid transport system transporter-binding protein [Rhodoferax ferrireducens]|uniref:Phospholipid transport system transporter-binding protein n=1 Tax=Rhodoferax ferrireducens TaxID=192843 RepID=A0ABU2CFN2_9BURK|nr:STAS domain-containing protein [Rhodoferax ferrireducens]MDR7380137.1 phospholipid transport system transporter-binding protein [Rhodoferax ferrireducens]
MLVLPAELTHAQATASLRMLVQGLRSQPAAPVVLDATALSRFDSSALAVMLECRRESMAMGRAFAVRGLPERLAALAGLYGVAELLPAAV